MVQYEQGTTRTNEGDMMEASTDSQTNMKSGKSRKAFIDKSAVIIILLVTIIVAGSGRYFYQKGFDKGTEKGKKDAVKRERDDECNKPSRAVEVSWLRRHSFIVGLGRGVHVPLPGS